MDTDFLDGSDVFLLEINKDLDRGIKVYLVPLPASNELKHREIAPIG